MDCIYVCPVIAALIRSELLFAGILMIVGSLAQVVLANLLTRLESDIEQGRTEYCGAC